MTQSIKNNDTPLNITDIRKPCNTNENCGRATAFSSNFIIRVQKSINATLQNIITKLIKNAPGTSIIPTAN